MDRALELARAVRAVTPPNPWVGCVIQAPDGTIFEGATAAVGGPHAEAAALVAAGERDLTGATADGSSQWITGPEARADAHALRAESDSILVGAGTVRADDPSLTVRAAPAPRGDPERIVLGEAPAIAKVRPCLEHRGDVEELLEELGAKGHLQLLVEGGAMVAHD